MFTNIGGQARNNLARILSDGTISAWNPNANNIVYSLVVGGGVVYAGGAFSFVGGQTRNRIAALNPTTGAATLWNPNGNSTVFAMILDGSTLYAGGVGSSPRFRGLR